MAQIVQGLPIFPALWVSTHTLQVFIEAIDAIDNGISQYPNDIKPLYKNRTDLSSRVGHLNPAWNQSLDAQAVDVRSGAF